jgi:hypothetical protein
MLVVFLFNVIVIVDLYILNWSVWYFDRCLIGHAIDVLSLP